MPTSAAAWHARRHALIRRRHPEIQDLVGHDSSSALWIVALATLQILLAIRLRSASYPTLILGAYMLGTFLSHALGVLIHETSHNLVAKRGWANKAWALVANLPLVAPAAVEFRYQHLLHHRFLGDADGKDTQAPTRAEARLVGTSWAMKLLSFTFGRFFYASRPANKVPRDGWLAANWGIQIAGCGLLAYFVGARPIVYLLVSALAAFGPHPLGARRISEHLPALRDQPTNSYYGVLNRVSFNVGYHVEHHDFPAIAWRRLPQVRESAREEYDRLFSVRSWTLLLANYVSNTRIRVDHYQGMGISLQEEALAERRDPPVHTRLSWWELPEDYDWKDHAG
jgi:sphingolipid delta-4 desaturase